MHCFGPLDPLSSRRWWFWGWGRSAQVSPCDFGKLFPFFFRKFLAASITAEETESILSREVTGCPELTVSTVVLPVPPCQMLAGQWVLEVLCPACSVHPLCWVQGRTEVLLEIT